jgi:hypothetical protein
MGALDETDVGAVARSKKAAADQAHRAAQLVVRPGEPASEIRVSLGGDGWEVDDGDEQRAGQNSRWVG